MKKYCTAIALFAVVFWAKPLLAQAPIPELAFDSAPDFLKLPDNVYLGEAVGVAVNSKGHVFVYHRTGSTVMSRLFEFDQNGKFVREIGVGLYAFIMAERLRIDPQDNIWITDQASNMVIKFTPDGKVAMTFGRRPEPELFPNAGPPPPPPAAPPANAPIGAGQPTDAFNKPADVAWDAAGNIFIADGHGNSRIAKFDKTGKFVKSWGSRGSEPGLLNLPHGIAVDARGNVYVSDRGNRRIQVFDNDGNFKAQYPNIQTTALCITSGAHQYLYSANQNNEIYKMELDGTIIGKIGRPGKMLKEFNSLHPIDCSRTNENEIYVGEVNMWRVQKLTVRPTVTSSRE
jgi:DNA-binding beta-propeller fold protein YncE